MSPTHSMGKNRTTFGWIFKRIVEPVRLGQENECRLSSMVGGNGLPVLHTPNETVICQSRYWCFEIVN